MHRQLPLRYIIGSVLRRKGSACLTLGSFFLVTLIWIALQAMITTIDQTLQESSLPDRGVLLSSHASAENQSRLSHEFIHAFEGFAPLSMNSKGFGNLVETISATTYAERSGRRYQISVRGLDLEQAKDAFPKFRLVQGDLPPSYSYQALAGRNLASSLQVSIGDTVKAWRKTWIISGLFEDRGTPFESELWVDDQTLQLILSRREPTSAWFRVANPGQFDHLKTLTEKELHGQSSVVTEAEFFSKKAFATEELRLLVAFVSLILSTGAVLSSLNTLYASLSGRESELATFRALGFRKSAVIQSVLTEAVLISVTGGLLAVVTALALNGLTFRTLISGIGYLSFSLSIQAAHLWSGIFFSMVMGLTGGLFPARQSVRKSVIDSLQRAAGILLVGSAGLISAIMGGFLVSAVNPYAAQAQTLTQKMAQTSTKGHQIQEITLNEAKTRAHILHPSLSQKEFILQQNHLSEKIERLNRWPSAQLFSQFYLLSSPNQFPRADQEGNLELVSKGKPNDFILRLEVRQSLTDNLQSRFSQRSLRRERDQLNLEKQLTWTGIEIDLEYLFLKWNYLIQEEQVHAEKLTLLRIQVERQERSMEAGYATELALFPAELEFYDALQEERRIRQEKSLVMTSIQRYVTPDEHIRQMGSSDPKKTPIGIVLIPAKNQNDNQKNTQSNHREETAEVVCELLCEETVEIWSITKHPYLKWFELSQSMASAEQQRAQVQTYPRLDLAGRLDYTGPSNLFGADLPGLSPVQARIGLELRYLLKESRTASLEEQRRALRVQEIQKMQLEWIRQMDHDVRQLLVEIRSLCLQRRQYILRYEQLQRIHALRKQEADKGLISPEALEKATLEVIAARKEQLQSDWAIQELKFDLARLLARPPSVWAVE